MKTETPLTVRSLKKLLPYRNAIWKLRLSRGELSAVIREEIRSKRKPHQVPFVDGGGFTISSDGEVRCDTDGKSRDLIVLAVSDFLLMRNRRLRRIAVKAGRALEPCGFGEAEAVEAQLSR